MIPDEHPYFYLERLFVRAGAKFNFSRYVYTPDSLFDERETFEVEGSDISQEWLEAEFEKLKVNEELALHSDVLIEGRKLHIPMIDFSASKLAPRELDRVRSYLPRHVLLASAFYHSGRSYHGYSTHLMGPKEWHDFMGRLLLINPRGGAEVVDSRWIGHRLIAGYSSLRFSNNTQQYHGMPKRVSIKELWGGS